MKKILNLIIILLMLFLFQGCIFKNNPPKILEMTPQNGESLTDKEVKFSWKAEDPDNDLLYYNFYLFSNTDKKVIKDIKEYTETEINLSLDEDKTYSWKLEAVDKKGNLDRKIIEFRIEKINKNPPTKTFLINPRDGAEEVFPYEIKFQWIKSVDFDGDNVYYNLYLDESTSLITPIATYLTKTEYTVKDLKLNTKYYWKVVVFDSMGASETSDIWTFKTDDNTPPVVDFPAKTFVIKENEKFELDLKNFVYDRENDPIEYHILTNNKGAMIERSKYIFKPDYDFVKHPDLTKQIQEQIVVSDTKENSLGVLNIIVQDVNQTPENPEFIYPKNNSIIPDNIRLNWNGVDKDNDKLKFSLYMGNNPMYLSPIATNLEDTYYDISLEKNKVYYLKVMSEDPYGEKSWSEVYKIKTTKEPVSLEWQKEIEDIKDMFIYDEKIYVITNDKIYKLNTDSSENNIIEVEGLLPGGIIYNGILYIPSENGEIKVIDLSKFIIQKTISLEISDTIIGLTAGQNTLYITVKNGNIVAYDLSRDTVKFNKIYEIEPIAPLTIIENGKMVISGNYENSGKIIITKPLGKVLCEIDLSNKLTGSIISDENYNLYFATGEKLYSYTQEGDENWEITLSDNIYGEGIYDGEYVYVSGNSKIFKISKSGKLKASYSIANLYNKSKIIHGNNIYIFTKNGIYKNFESTNNKDEFGEILSSSFNDGLLLGISQNNLYALSIIPSEEATDNIWCQDGKNSEHNRNLYSRNNHQPEKPVLIYPENQRTEVPIKVTLSWKGEDPEDDPLKYTIYLAQENEELQAIGTTEATYFNITLENNKRYYWKIIASDGEFETESDIYSFKTILKPADLKFKKYIGSAIQSPAISEDNTIYFSTSDGAIYALDTYGNIIWKYNTEGFIKAPVVLNPINQIIIGDELGELYIINPDGTLYEKTELEGPISKPVSIGVNGEIFVVTDTGILYKFGAFGNEIWKKELFGNATTNIVVNGNNLYLGIGQFLYGLSSNTGEELFKISFAQQISTDLSMDKNGNIYFGTKEKKIYGYDLYGNKIFEKELDEVITGSIVVDTDNSIVFVGESGYLYKYYYITDILEKDLYNEQLYNVTLTGEYKYLGGKKSFRVINSTEEWTYQDTEETQLKLKSSPNIDENGVIVFGTLNGFIYGVYGDSIELKDSGWPIYLGDRKHTGNIHANLITMPDNRPPIKPYNPYPADKSTLSLKTLTLKWESYDPDGDSVTYDLYFGNVQEPGLKAKNITAKNYEITNLVPGTYYWKVIAKDSEGNITSGPLWVFTITESSNENNPPLEPELLEPADKAENIPTTVTLKWQGNDPDGDTLKYDIYISDSQQFTTPKESDYTNTDYTVTLDSGKTYYWKVVAKDGKGGETSSKTYSFTTALQQNTPPDKPVLLSPQNNATDIEPDITLQWSCSDPDGDSLTYDVYLSTDPNLSTPYKTNLANTSLSVSNLQTGATYYWKVVAKDGKGGETSSDTYSFTIKEDTGPLVPKLYFKDTTIQSGSKGNVIIHGQVIENIQACDIEITYDPAKLSITENDIKGIGELTGKGLLISISNGKISISILSLGGTFSINNSDILQLTFKAIGTPGETELRFTDNTKFASGIDNYLDIDISDVGKVLIQ
ncbi:PQQ-binding-like beta-propeller repeat protein [Marinitoga sp. 1138]|uniref:outer membrane protein assembly factor BamB family protein n=1 Tax=Marinitoga sp. 1138 TaxID=1643334 RepID=UPI001585F105|nr:PQQ-binding-like beta-propeller repeat protein [Marinitoga sp. 1138]NUU97559.1 hypothetical protein [Marinitoga sp. 1138]